MSSTSKYSLLQRLTEEYDIALINNHNMIRWPSEYDNILETVRRIENCKIDTDAEQDAKPGMKELKKLAEKLTNKADDNRRRNESTWRYTCENLIWNRLSIDIACKNCRERLWRAQFEVRPDSKNGASSDLEARQKRRRFCSCPLGAGKNEGHESVGLDRLYIMRTDEVVIHSPDDEKDLPRNQRPDRIHGLRETGTFKSLLNSRSTTGCRIKDLLQRQPVSDEGEALLFPFLVLEAKKSGSEDWNYIFLQTAFPIYTFLKVQRRLEMAASSSKAYRSRLNPLVWFFANRGDQYRCYVAYQTPRTGRSVDEIGRYTTNVVNVWEGSIHNKDKALQLLLLVESIADWARDSYRDQILACLFALASKHGPVSEYEGSTILSQDERPLAQPPISATKLDLELDSRLIENSVPTQTRFHDTPDLAVRHISPIESRFLCILITGDSIETFFNYLDRSIQSRMAFYIAKQFHDAEHNAQLLSKRQLCDIETLWTKGSSISDTRDMSPRADRRFYTIHQVTYYLSPQWEQVRELCVISIEKTAFDSLIQKSKKSAKSQYAKKPDCPDDSHFLDRLCQLRGASAEENLLRTISRFSCYIRSDLQLSKSSDWRATWAGSISGIVNVAYQANKSGEVDPEFPKTCISKQKEDQPVDTDNLQTRQYGAYPDLHVSGKGGVLLTSTSRVRKSQSCCCLYLVTSPVETLDEKALVDCVKTTYETRDVYHTTTIHGKFNPKTGTNTCVWNLERCYGVVRECNGFKDWLKSIGSPPIRTGSSVGSETCGWLDKEVLLPCIERNLTCANEHVPISSIEGSSSVAHEYAIDQGSSQKQSVTTPERKASRVANQRKSNGKQRASKFGLANRNRCLIYNISLTVTDESGRIYDRLSSLDDSNSGRTYDSSSNLDDLSSDGEATPTTTPESAKRKHGWSARSAKASDPPMYRKIIRWS